MRAKNLWCALIVLALIGGCASDEPTGPDPVSTWRQAGEQLLQSASCVRPGPTCPGAKAPDLSAPDFNPSSLSFETNVSVAPSNNRPKVVALLAGW
ncbi:MAG TPA: hypothetical protein DCQ06_03655 [Myxococcales bacterium]|nr:hypothetical protein [Myxococcales bacterium]